MGRFAAHHCRPTLIARSGGAMAVIMWPTIVGVLLVIAVAVVVDMLLHWR
jgi:hypothetical protein